MPVYETSHGTWRVRWYDVDGRQQSATRKTRKLADRLDAEMRADTGRGLPTARPKPTSVTAAARAWLTSAHNLDDSTRRIYREALDHILPALGDRPIHSLSAAAVNEYLASRRGQAAPSSIHREYRTLRRLLRVSGYPNVITRDTVPAPKVPHEEMMFLTADQLERLADSISGRYRSLVLVAGYGGLRWGELAGLRPGDIDATGRRVHVAGQLSVDGKRWKPETKTRVRRWVSLPASVIADLADASGQYVWTFPQGGSLEHSRFRTRYWYPATASAGLGTWRTAGIDKLTGKRTPSHYEGLRFHDLRHTAAALAAAAGAKPKEVQAMLGHASIQTTYDRYGHLFPEAQADLAARLDAMRAGTRKLRAV